MSKDRPLTPSQTSRRQVLAALSAAAVAGAAGAPTLAEGAAAKTPPTEGGVSTLTFTEVEHHLEATHAVSPGHDVQVLLRWGDPVLADAPAWNPQTQTGAAQHLQFGYDNDFIAFKPMPFGSNSSDHGLLCVNHESARNHMMFTGFTSIDTQPKEQIDIEMAAIGFSIIEIQRKGGTWNAVPKSAYNRRISATTPIAVGGPAAGHTRMRTADDPDGRTVLGTFGNCAGGETPWGTVLTAEENVQYFFGGDASKTPEARNHRLMGQGTRDQKFYSWERFYPRFSVETEPREFNRFGWMVEIDPYDVKRQPVKRTAMGRFKHEGAGVVINNDGRIVCYMGDDQSFQFIYKFVSQRAYDPKDRTRNWGLLDDGTLYVGKFDGDNTVTWLPLVWGTGPLTAANGFADQGEVVIEARRAAALLGATPMDRPEDIEFNKTTGSVFVALSKNPRRNEKSVDAANPRVNNAQGHIMEILPGAAGDHAAAEARWQIFLLAGDPGDPKSGAQYNPGVSKSGWLSNPDNFVFDPKGRMWIGTDGANDFGYADGLWATDVVGAGRALTKLFFSCPIGGEMTGPAFTPDGTTLFCSIQHPGDVGDMNGSNFDKPLTRWPDFKDGTPPRPSVIAIRTAGGKPIG